MCLKELGQKHCTLQSLMKIKILFKTYLGGIEMTTSDRIRAEEIFPISKLGYAIGKLLDATECHMILDTGESKSFRSKTHYLRCKSCTHYQSLHIRLRIFR